MARLHILRHGKAERDSSTGRDFDRELRPRGERQAAFIGATLLEREGKRKGVIVSSPAARALATATFVQEALGWPLSTDDRIVVGADPADALEVAREALGAKGVESVVVVGHNPTLEALVDELEKSRGRGAAMRTGELASFDVEIGPGGAAEVRSRGRTRLEGDDD